MLGEAVSEGTALSHQPHSRPSLKVNRESVASFTSMPDLKLNDRSTPQAEAADADVEDAHEQHARKHVLFTVPGPSTNADTEQLKEPATPDSRKISEAEITLERLPAIENYRLTLQKQNSVHPSTTRPTIAELMHGAREAAIAEKDFEIQRARQMQRTSKIMPYNPKLPPPKPKLDFFQGVFIPVFTNIVGSLLYLRNSWVAGQAGLLAGFGIVLLSALVCVVTAVSISGICSNGETKKGGLYYVISRSLGPEFGGSIGAIFAIANAMMASLYIVSVAETIADLLEESGYGIVTNSRINDIRLFGIVICLVLMLITFAGPDIEQSATLFMFSLYHLSFIDWCLGSIIPPTVDQRMRGMTGYSLATISENLLPAWRNENFISVYAVLFPGMTGLMAGSMFVNELRDQARDVPLGMFTAVGVCVLYNLIAVFISASTVLRDVPGDVMPVFDNLTQSWEPFPCALNYTCSYGLMNFFQVAQIESAWGPILIAGIFAMSLSSTMTNLDNGPQIFQAMCKDKLFPFFGYFSKEYDLNIPQRAYIFFSILTMGVVLIGDLNVINGFVSNLFLAAYASVNYACFDASFAKSPGFRPSFRFYNMWLSLAGAGLCITVMFIISWHFALLIFAFFFMIFVYLSRRRLDMNWGSSTSAVRYRIALRSLLKLSGDMEHAKNYRPQILLMTGNPAARSSLLDFGACITKGESVLIAAHVIQYEANERTFRTIRRLDIDISRWFISNRVRAFYLPFANRNIRSGVQHLLQIAGLGRLRPNILMLGFRNKWSHRGRDGLLDVMDYVGIIRDAFENNFGVGILRNGNDGFDVSEKLLDLNIRDIIDLKEYGLGRHLPHHRIIFEDSDRDLVCPLDRRGESSEEEMSRVSSIQSQLSYADASRDPENISIILRTNSLYRRTSRFFADRLVFGGGTTSRSEEDLRRETQQRKPSNLTGKQKQLAIEMNKFHRRIKKGRIDVWWLYDDGGLTLLIPHLLRLHKSYLEGAELRVFTLASSHACAQADEKKMAALLSKFRIPFADVRVIADIAREPHPSTIRDFEAIIAPMRATETDKRNGLISDLDLATQKKRTSRQLRTRELLQLHSHQANLIVITLPVPRLEISSSLYMAWLDLMTRDLPPVLMIRGNQTSVLTFYT